MYVFYIFLNYDKKSQLINSHAKHITAMSVSPLYLYRLFQLIWSDCATQLGIFHILVLKGNPYFPHKSATE